MLLIVAHTSPCPSSVDSSAPPPLPASSSVEGPCLERHSTHFFRDPLLLGDAFPGLACTAVVADSVDFHRPRDNRPNSPCVCCSAEVGNAAATVRTWDRLPSRYSPDSPANALWLEPVYSTAPSIPSGLAVAVTSAALTSAERTSLRCSSSRRPISKQPIVPVSSQLGWSSCPPVPRGNLKESGYQFKIIDSCRKSYRNFFYK